MTESSVLAFDGAAFHYADGGGVSGLDLEIEPGAAVAMIGPNGAGKSTVLRGILGLVGLSAGRMRVGTSEHAVPGMIGFLPQSVELDPEFPITLRQVVMQGRYRRLGILRWPGRADRAAVDDALEAVGLTTLAQRRFGELSGGQRQRGLLARALAGEPEILLLDEPFNGLDQPNREALTETVRSLKKRGVAVLLSTHDLELARQVCDSVLLINGTQLAFGPVDDTLTLANVQACFDGHGVEVDEHTVMVPDHEGH